MKLNNEKYSHTLRCSLIKCLFSFVSHFLLCIALGSCELGNINKSSRKVVYLFGHFILYFIVDR